MRYSKSGRNQAETRWFFNRVKTFNKYGKRTKRYFYSGALFVLLIDGFETYSYETSKTYGYLISPMKMRSF